MIKMNKLAAAILVAAVGLNLQAKVMESSVATVNGRPILASEYNTTLQNVIAEYKENAPQVLQQPYAEDILGKSILERMIANELVSQEAQAQGITVKDSEVDEMVNREQDRFLFDPKTGKEDKKGAAKRFSAALKKEGLTLDSYKKRIKKVIAADKLISKQVQERVKPVEEADAKALYENVNVYLKNNTKKIKELEKNKQKAAEAKAIAAKLKQLTSEQVLMGHIFLAANKNMPAAEIKQKEELAKKIKKEIDNGMDFSTAVKTYSEDKEQSAVTGGDMILIKGISFKELDAKAFSLPVGKVSDPIKTEIGYHIIKIKEKKAEKQITFDDVKNNLGQYIAQTRVEETMNTYINELAEKADIKITKEFEVDKAIEKAKAEKETAAKTEKK